MTTRRSIENPTAQRLFQATVLLIALTALMSRPICARADLDHDAGLWLMSLNQGSLTPKNETWRWWFDAHARFSENAEGFEQSIVRPGLGYRLNEGNTVFLGYAWIATTAVNRPTTHEHRIWQQHVWSTQFDRFGFMSRSRLEQRFRQTGSDVSWRFRQFIKLTHPVAFEDRLFASAWDEIFFNLNNTDWGARSGLDRNRIFAGLGWKFDTERNITTEVGYLNQFANSSGRPDRMTHILSLNLFASF